MPRKGKRRPSGSGGSRDASGEGQGDDDNGGPKEEQPHTKEGADELEEHLILRLPQEHANKLREAMRTGTLKNRLKVEIDPDMRVGKVYLDDSILHGKVLDLPTHVETLKTTDNKSFYKTADVAQMLVCTEEQDPATPDATTEATKYKDPIRVDKKFLLPHGLTPPLKNVRKWRYRRPIKNKIPDTLDVQKEVGNLLRMDQEAVHVRWEVVDEDEVVAGAVGGKASNNGEGNMCLTEQDIFGEVLSDSQDPESQRPHMRMESVVDASSSSGDSEMSNSSFVSSLQGLQLTVTGKKRPRVKKVFQEHPSSCSSGGDGASGWAESAGPSSIPSTSTASRDPGEILARLRVLREEIPELRGRRLVLEEEVEGTRNLALRKRFQIKLKNVIAELDEKEREREELRAMIH